MQGKGCARTCFYEENKISDTVPQFEFENEHVPVHMAMA